MLCRTTSSAQLVAAEAEGTAASPASKAPCTEADCADADLSGVAALAPTCDGHAGDRPASDREVTGLLAAWRATTLPMESAAARLRSRTSVRTWRCETVGLHTHKRILG